MIERGRRGGAGGALALVAIALFARSASAAPSNAPLDEVVLHDGTHLVGRVVERTEGRAVTIETSDGRLRTFAWGAVREVNLAAPARAGAGGGLGYELRGGALVMIHPTETFATEGLCATGTGVTPASMYGGAPSGRAWAAGGAIGGRAAYVYAWRPQLGGQTTFWGARAATGLDLGELYLRAPRGPASFTGELCGRVAAKTAEVSYESRALFFVGVPLTLGGQVGFGGFHDTSVWRGVVLGLAWAPSYVYVKPSSEGGAGGFRLRGIEATADFTTFDARGTDRGPVPHLRLAATLLAPSGDGEPFVALLGVGAAWY